MALSACATAGLTYGNRMRVSDPSRLTDINVRRLRRSGLTNTFEAADIFGTSALRNGTWGAAMANSLVHVNFQAAAKALMHMENNTIFLTGRPYSCRSYCGYDRIDIRPVPVAKSNSGDPS